MPDRVSIIVPDNMVAINGVAKPVDCSALAEEFKHAVQWDGTRGVVQFAQEIGAGIPGSGVEVRPPEYLDSIEPYQSYIDAWHAVPEPEPPPPLVAPNPVAEANRANQRLDAGIAASSGAATAARRVKEMPPHSSPPTVDELQAQIDWLAAEVARLADSYVGMVDAQVIQGAPPEPMPGALDEGRNVIIAFTRPLDPTSIPDRFAFTIQIDAVPANPAGAVIDGSILTLTLGIPAASKVAVSYAPPATNPLQAVDGAPVAEFDDLPITLVVVAGAKA